MAGNWREYTFADLIQAKALEIGDGYRAKNSELGGDGPIFLRAGHVRDTHIDFDGVERFQRELAKTVASKMSRPGDVIVTTKGNSTGRTSYVGDDLPPFVYSPHLSYWRSLDERRIVPRFLRYWSRSQEFREQLAGLAASTDMAPYLSLVDQKSLRVVLPAVEEQRAIAHILGTLDDKIELNRRMNETLEGIARALFKSWLVDFDPVRAKAAGRDPGLPEPIADLFPDSFEESDLGEIPTGWRVKKLSDLCSTQYGYTASAVEEPVGPKFLRVMDINKQNWIDWAAVPYCGIDAELKGVYALKVGDLVVARMADPGKSAIIDEEVDAVFASYLVRLKAESLAHSYYIYGFLKSDLYAEYAEGAKSGSVQANMNAKVIVGVSLIVPPSVLLERYRQAVLPLRQRLVTSVRQSRSLAALRDALLPKLLAGNLRLPATEKLLEAGV